MFAALNLAFEDTVAPEQRRAIAISLGLALVLLAGLWVGVDWALAEARVAGISWLDTLIAIAGGLAALLLAWLLFPALTLLILGFFLDGVVANVEKRHYPGVRTIRRRGVTAGLGGALRLALLALLLNLLALPIYLTLPAINFLVYYLLNGYLVGREYFALVALRRVDEGAARAMWRRHRGRLVLAGIVIVFLLSLPLIDLVAPVMAAAFMLHVFEGLRRNGPPETFAGSRRIGLMED
jgi:CysZ protein